VQTPLHLLLVLGKHLPHNICLDGKLPGHLSMAVGSNPHPLRQGALLQGANYGQAQLGPPDLSKGMFLDKSRGLPLGLFPPSDTDLVHQAWEFGLGHVLGLAHVHKLVLEKGRHPNHIVGFLVNRSQ
jgi:hypothetical protein